MRFSERLQSLGFSDYQTYLASPHWQEFKQCYRASGLPMLCAVCGSKPIQLHHHDYTRLGSEQLADVTPLCRTHHEEIHGVLKENRWPVNLTARAVLILRGAEPVPASPKNRQKKKHKQKDAGFLEWQSRRIKIDRETEAGKHKKPIAKQDKKHQQSPQKNEQRKRSKRPKFLIDGSPAPPLAKEKKEKPISKKLLRKIQARREKQAIEDQKWNDPTLAMKMLAAGLRPPQ